MQRSAFLFRRSTRIHESVFLRFQPPCAVFVSRFPLNALCFCAVNEISVPGRNAQSRKESEYLRCVQNAPYDIGVVKEEAAYFILRECPCPFFVAEIFTQMNKPCFTYYQRRTQNNIFLSVFLSETGVMFLYNARISR